MGRQTTDYETWYFRQIPWADERVPNRWHAAWFRTGTAVCGDYRARLSATERLTVPPGVDFTDVAAKVCRRCLNHANKTPTLTRRDAHGGGHD